MDDPICRICLDILEDKYKIELDETFKGAQLFVSINSIANIEIQENDGLPSAICLSCYKNFQTALNFKETCELSNLKLRQYKTTNTQMKYELKYESDLSELNTVEQNDDINTVETSTFTEPYNSDNSIDQPEYLFINELSCNRCNAVFKTPRTLSIHQTHNKCAQHFECDDCGEVFKSKCKMSVHWKKTHYLSKLVCPKCKKQCKSYVAFNKHKLRRTCQKVDVKWMSVTGVGNNRVFNCKECPYKTKRVTYILTHIRQHTGEKPFKCKLCPQSFSQPGPLKTHQVMKHKMFSTNINCPICGKILPSKLQLKRHLLGHNDTMKTCPVCHGSFKGRYLKTHMARHTSSKTFTCEKCAKSFYSIAELYTHRRKVHEKILVKKKYKCDLCNYGTSALKLYQNHVANHKIGKQICTICFSFCKDKNRLDKHIAMHKDEGKKYACEYCDLKYHSNKGRRKHIEIKHSIVISNMKDQKIFDTNTESNIKMEEV